MNVSYIHLYEDMMAEIRQCQSAMAPETDIVENCYRCAISWLEKLCKPFKSRGFTNDEDEIFFFKSIKPTFSGQIEYFMTIYQALIFCPMEGEAVQLSFWEYEKTRMFKFYQVNEHFIWYVKSGRSDMDSLYFLRKNNDDRSLWPTKIYNNDPYMSTSYDHILATMIAYEFYQDYIKHKINQLTNNV